MPRTSKKLSALEVSRLVKPGKHPVGESLYLQISEQGNKSWIFRYTMNGKAAWMGLGPCRIVSLAEARQKVLEHQKKILSGKNPLEEKIRQRQVLQVEEARKITFDECAFKYIEAHAPGWKNEKHEDQWRSTLKIHVSPIFGSLLVQSVDTSLVLKALEPIWYETPETASRVRGRVERILSWATVRGHREGVNPALWRGHLDQLLPKRSIVQKVEHFKALPFKKIGTFMTELRKESGVSPRALEFLILTVTRTSETLLAKWPEFNFDERCWTIPAERMKAKKEHRVPLSSRAVEILQEKRIRLPWVPPRKTSI